MKKSILFLMLSACFSNGYAADNSALLDIQGHVTTVNVSCAVYLDSTTLALWGDLNKLPSQTEMLTTGADVKVTIGSNYSAQNLQCLNMANEGKLAYRLTGIADNADGVSLANDDKSTGAAKGIGIGIYSDGKLVKINKDILAAHSYGNVLSLTFVKLNGQTSTVGSVHGNLTIQFERL